MEPKEKAEELVSKFGLARDEDGFINPNKHRHRQCALIAVDELLSIAETFGVDRYWQEVKEELEKL